MKLVIASDIHGSAKWCREVMNVIEREAPDKIVLLGDLLYHGPRNPLPDEYAPAEVAAMLNGVADRIVSVRGNCEAEVDQMMLQFPCMADYAWIVDGPHQLYCTHGHLREPGNLPPLPNGEGQAYVIRGEYMNADEKINGSKGRKKPDEEKDPADETDKEDENNDE